MVSGSRAGPARRHGFALICLCLICRPKSPEATKVLQCNQRTSRGRMRPDAASTVVITFHRSRRMVRGDLHWLGLWREQDAADDHAREKSAATVKTGTPSFRREGSDPCSCLSKSSQSRRSMENLLYRKHPHENPEKGPAFPVSPCTGCFKKLMHKTLIREIDESCHPTTTFSSLLA